MREPETPAAFRVLFIWATSSPSQALTRQTPPFVTCGDIFPRSGGSLSSKGEPLAKPVTWHLSRKLYRHAKASPFGRGGCERSEQTERARLLPAAPPLPQEAGAAAAVLLHGPSRENGLPERPQTLRQSEIINVFSLAYGQSKAEAISNHFFFSCSFSPSRGVM